MPTWLLRNLDDTDGYVVDYFAPVEGEMRHIGYLEVDTHLDAVDVYVNDRVSYQAPSLILSKPKTATDLAESVSFLESTVPIFTTDQE